MPKDPHSLNKNEQSRTITPVIMCFSLLVLFYTSFTNKLGAEGTSIAFFVHHEHLLTPLGMIPEVIGGDHFVTVRAKQFILTDSSFRHGCNSVRW